MEIVASSLVLLTVVLISSVVAQVIPAAPASLLQIALGVVVALMLPGFTLDFDPEFFLLFFVAPLLYWDAIESDKGALWGMRRPVLAFAFGLVFLIVLVVGFATHLLIPSIPLAAAFALGAALGPTDAVATATLSKRLNFRDDTRSLLQGEFLLNDASGVVCFQFAIAALVTGGFSIVDASVTLAIDFVGGIALGAVLGLLKALVVRLVRRAGLEDVTFHVLLQLLMPFVCYILAEGVGVSGILAVVAAGIIDSIDRHTMLPSSARLSIVSTSVWNVVAFALNGMVFVMLGTLLPAAMRRTWASSIPNLTLIGYVIVLTFIVVAVRFGWCLAYQWLSRPKGHRNSLPNVGEVREAAILTLAGAKGAVTLSICLTLPRIAAGSVLACREMVIFLGAGVIVLTLLLANFVVPLLAEPKATSTKGDADQVAGRIDVLRGVINELSHDPSVTDRRAMRRVIASYQTRIDQLKTYAGEDGGAEMRLRERCIGWESVAVNKAIADHDVAPIVGYGYLIELEKRLSRLHQHGEFRWFVRNATGLVGMMRRAGTESWGVSSKVRSERRQARLVLKSRTADYVIEMLRSEPTAQEFPIEVISRITAEYRRSVAFHLHEAPAPSSVVRAIQTPPALQETRRLAYRIEREQIRIAREGDSINAATAREMRDCLSALEFAMDFGE